jgi:hypothetical protein
MSEFVGRTGSRRVYSYPEAQRGSALSTFARNFATGPKGAPAVAGQLEWNSIDVGSDPSSDVPITPRSTGIVVISGAVGLSNTSGAPIIVTVQVQVNGISIGSTFQSTIPDGSFGSIPFLAETIPADTPVGVTTPIQVFVSGAGAVTPVDSSAISVQEVSVATG